MTTTPLGAPASFELDFEKDEVYECGALLLTILAIPDGSASGKSEQLFRSLCAFALQKNHQLAPEDDRPVSAKPKYLFRPMNVVDREVDFVEKRLKERMAAGRVVTLHLRHAAGVPIDLPHGVKRVSINEMVQFFLESTGQSDVSNVKARIWRPSKSVIHLAAAVATIFQQTQDVEEDQIPFERFLIDQHFIRSIAVLAEQYADLIDNDSRFPVPASRLVRVTCT